MLSSKWIRRLAWYASALLAGGGAVVGCLGIVQYAVDPYDMFGHRKIPMVNSEKPFIYDNARVAKPRIIERIAPRAVLIGASTTEAGYDPDHPGFKSYDRVYNFGIGGGEFYETYRTFQHALSTSDVKLAVVAIDFPNWVGQAKASQPGFEESLLSVSEDGTPQPDWRNSWLWLLNPRRINNGLLTLHYQNTSYINMNNFPQHWVMANGQRYHDSYHRFLNLYGGFDQPFVRNIRSKTRGFSKLDPDKLFGPGQPERYFTLLDKMIDLAAEDGVKLTLNIPPCHISALEVYRHTRLLEGYWKFKTDLVSHLRNHPQQKKVGLRLYDFCVYDIRLSEGVLSRQDKRVPLSTFSDAFHFTTIVGDLALDYMLDLERSAQGFGADLLTAELSKYGKQQMRALERIKSTIPDELALISQIIKRKLEDQ